MTIDSNPFRVEHTGNGTTTQFAYDWKIFNISELIVTEVTISTDAEIALVVDDDYTVNGVNSDVPAQRYVEIMPAPSGDKRYVITPNFQERQSVDLTNQQSVPPERVELGLDHCVRLIKQLSEKVSRAVKITVGSQDDADTIVQTVTNKAAEATMSAAAAVTSETNVATKETNVTALEAQAQAHANAAAAAAAEGLYNKTISLTSANSPYQPIATDEGALYRIDTSGGAVVINLDALSDYNEDMVFAFSRVAGGNDITINAGGSDTIDSGASLTIDSSNVIFDVIGALSAGAWLSRRGEAVISDNMVTNAKLSQVPTHTIKGRVSENTGNIEDLTPAQARGLIDVYSKSESDALGGVAHVVARGQFDSRGTPSTDYSTNLSFYRTGTGKVTCTFDTARADSNYDVLANVIADSALNNIGMKNITKSAASFTIEIRDNYTNAYTDASFNVVVIGH